MKIDTLAHVKNQISAVIDQLGSEPLFITRNGKVAAVLQAVTDDEIEDYLLRNSQQFWRLIESRRAQASKGATRPFDRARYAGDKSPAVHGMTVREKSADYRTRKKRQTA
jgi:PHD/YefM family antitoxin component YafN of YafNO toxin-antitoxin module